ncbi:MAG TPA: glycosyltransferase family 39 protein [Actinomycetota bacterium]
MNGPARLRDGWRPCLAVFVAARLSLSLLSVVGVGLVDPLPPVDVPGRAGPDATPGWHNAIDATERQDAVWYLRLADAGWSGDDASAAFFPLYPLAVRAVSRVLPGDDLFAALVVSNVAFFLALLALFALTREAFGDRVARRAIVVAATFPTAFFFLAPYGESLFLLCSLLAFRAARHDRWWGVALFGALAALTRSVGVLLVPALLVEAATSRRSGAGRAVPVGAALAAGLGPLLWFGWWGVAHGRWLAPLDAQANWQRTVTWPWETIVDAVELAWRFGSYWLLDLAIVTVAIVGLALATPVLRRSEAVYGWLSVLLPLALPFPGRPLLSMPRFVVVVFPALLGLAGADARRAIPQPLVLSVLAGGWALCAVLFVNWLHVF